MDFDIKDRDHRKKLKQDFRNLDDDDFSEMLWSLPPEGLHYAREQGFGADGPRRAMLTYRILEIETQEQAERDAKHLRTAEQSATAAKAAAWATGGLVILGILQLIFR